MFTPHDSLLLPDLGFYHHFKHDPAQGLTHYAYEVLGVGWDPDEGTYKVTYRPLYDCDAYRRGVIFCQRLEKWFSPAPGGGERFTHIRGNPQITSHLATVSRKMYPMSHRD